MGQFGWAYIREWASIFRLVSLDGLVLDMGF